MEFEQPNAQRRKRGADGKKKKSKTSEERKEREKQETTGRKGMQLAKKTGDGSACPRGSQSDVPD